jgi:hypothetical protein
MATGLDGTIYLGESERISRLYLFFPIIKQAESYRRPK